MRKIENRYSRVKDIAWQALIGLAAGCVAFTLFAMVHAAVQGGKASVTGYSSLSVEETREETRTLSEKGPHHIRVAALRAREQDDALRVAETFVKHMPVSKAGLLRDLVSPYGGEYDIEAARWAVDRVKADWFAEATEAARGIMEVEDYNRDEMLEALRLAGFTREQADFAAAAVGLPETVALPERGRA